VAIVVTFDGPNKLIILNNGVTEIDVQRDLYSAWKHWLVDDGQTQWLPAFRVVGGDRRAVDAYLDATFFLINGWRVRPYEGDHELVVNALGGQLLVDFEEGGGAPFVKTLGSYNVFVQYTVSNIVNKLYTFQPGDRVNLEEIRDLAGIIPATL
jgi:hypothetical protein